MKLTGRQVLVTGAGGFIGSHLVEALVEKGARTRAFVHYNAMGGCGWLDHSPLAEHVDIVRGDITDRDSVAGAMAGNEIVFHLAALIGIPYSYRAPASYLRTNVEGTLNVLENARKLELARVVHTSTSEVYGTALSVPIGEDHPLQAQSPYAASKVAADKFAEAFNASFGLPVVTVRPFNTFGPRQSVRAVIPTIISQALSDVPEIRLGALTPTRDLNYVDNTVAGFIAAAEAENGVGHVVNIGSGAEISIGNLAALILELMNVDKAVSQEECRKRPKRSEVMRLVADGTKAQELLGWHPGISLRDGLSKTIDWYVSSGAMAGYRFEDYGV